MARRGSLQRRALSIYEVPRAAAMPVQVILHVYSHLILVRMIGRMAMDVKLSSVKPTVAPSQTISEVEDRVSQIVFAVDQPLRLKVPSPVGKVTYIDRHRNHGFEERALIEVSQEDRVWKKRVLMELTDVNFHCILLWHNVPRLSWTAWSSSEA